MVNVNDTKTFWKSSIWVLQGLLLISFNLHFHMTLVLEYVVVLDVLIHYLSKVRLNRFQLFFKKCCRENHCHWFSLSTSCWLLTRKIFIPTNCCKPWTLYNPKLLEISFFFETILRQIHFLFHPITKIVKASKHLLNTIECTNCKKGVGTFTSKC